MNYSTRPNGNTNCFLTCPGSTSGTAAQLQVNTQINSTVQAADEINCSYNNPFLACFYEASTGAKVADQSAPKCPANAVKSSYCWDLAN